MKICKFLLVGFFISLCMIDMTGQVRFSHAIGASYYASKSANTAGIVYSPRVNLLNLNNKITLSAGTHLGIGFAFASSGSNTSTTFHYDLPLVAEINFGHGAHKEVSSRFGGFLGAGYGFNRMQSVSDSPSDYRQSNGFLINGGLRFKIKNASWGVRASYLFNHKAGGGNITSLGVFYTFGK